ncbi:pre-peptidase C-terminal domain-containing protein [Scytonema sp. PCC 10023]|uniref:pre-peptidase C-terminal domain-containing protein n=1 Tax=Scytonema sp. PCC 10023 TaxID=1680591 RepID=UPI0039C61EA7
MSNYDIGLLPANGNAVTRNDYTLTPGQPTDVFEFRINSTRNINVALTGITAGDDADLRLFRDINNNGILDATDRGVNNANAIGTSTRGGNADDSINLADRAAGTYFAEVSRYAPGSQGNVTYDIAVSSADPSNLLPREVELGNLSRDVTQTGQVGNNDTADIYHFSLGLFEGVNINLSGLSADADIRLIQDRNGNRIVEDSEVIRSSTNGGTLADSIRGINTSGDYYLEVYQYSGNTNYTLTFDHYNTTFPLT